MQLRSGITVGKQLVDIATMGVTNMNNDDSIDDTPILCAKQMSDLIGPLLLEISAIDRVVRKMPVILQTFHTMNRCDMNHMIHNRTGSMYRIVNFALTVLHKVCDLTCDTVNHIVQNDSNDRAFSDEEKGNFIDALTEIDKTKWYLIELIGEWITSTEITVGTALLQACADDSSGKLGTIYKGVVNNSFFRWEPPFSMNNKCNEGYSQQEVFAECFENPVNRGFIRANCFREFHVCILGKSGEDVFGKRSWEVMQESFDDIFRMIDENNDMQRKIDMNCCNINDTKLSMDELVK